MGGAQDDILNEPVRAPHNIEAWRILQNKEPPHREDIKPEQFRLAREVGYGKAGRCPSLEDSPIFPEP